MKNDELRKLDIFESKVNYDYDGNYFSGSGAP